MMKTPLRKSASSSSRISKPSRRRPILKPLFRVIKGEINPCAIGSAGLKKMDQNESNGAIDSDMSIVEDLSKVQTQLAPGFVLASATIEDVMAYIQSHMFSPVPNRRSGMSSIRVAGILNHRIQLPPLVPIANVYALSSSSPTATERELAGKIQAGIIRKVTIPRRGRGSSIISEALILVPAWEQVLNSYAMLSADVKTNYMAHIRNTSDNPIPFTDDEVQLLFQSGLLTYSASATTSAMDSSKVKLGNDYALALPNTGPFLKILSSARDHLHSLLSESSPYQPLPLGRLRERWNGNAVEIGDILADSGEISGAPTGVLPGKTKKWRQFWGLSFEWVLAEALDAGVVECFATKSIGTGVRLV